MPNAYTLSLGAQVSTAALAALQTQLDNFAKTYTLKLNAAVQQVQQAATQAATGGGTGGVAATINTDTDAVAKFNAEISSMNPTVTVTNNLLDQTTKASQTMATGLGTVETRTISLSKNLKNFTDTTRESAVATKSWIGDLMNAFEKIALWAVATGAVYGTLKAIKDGTQYIIDLNKAMTETQMVTGFSSEKIQQLTQDYHNMAMELSSTTLDVQAASLAWLRQGKSASDAALLTKDSIMMAKLAITDTATASEYLTAILNGFQMSATDAIGIMDKLLALSNSTKTSAAVSFEVLSEAMKVSAAEANNVGISFSSLASYIATIGTITQQSGETIGNSLKMMMTRMEQVKAGVTEGEDSFNNVQIVLKKYGMTLLDTAGQFKPLEEVIDELGQRWQDLDKFQQMQLVTAIGGARQANSMVALMDNYSKALQYQTAQTESAGLAAQRYADYQDSVEASANRAKTAWEGVWQTTISTGAIKGWNDLSAAIAGVINKMGGLIPVATAIGIVFAALNLEKIIGAFVALNAAIGPIGWAILAVSAIVIAANAIWKTNAERLQEVNKALDDNKIKLDAARSSQSSLASLGQEYENLRNKSKLTNDEQQRFWDIQEQIHQLLPLVGGSFDDSGHFIITVGTSVDILNKKLEQNIIDLQNQHNELIKNQTLSNLALIPQKPVPQSAASFAIQAGWAEAGTTGAEEGISPEELAKYAQDMKTWLDAERAAYLSVDNVTRKWMVTQYAANKLTKDQIDYITHLDDVFSGVPSVVDNASSAIEYWAKVQENVRNAALLSTDQIKAFSDQVEATRSKVNDLVNALQQQASGTLTANGIADLLDKYPELINDLEVVNGATQFNTELLRQRAIELISNNIQENQATIASLQNAIALHGESVELENQIALLKAKNYELWLTQQQLFQPTAAPSTTTTTGGGGAASTENKALNDMLATIRAEKQAEIDALNAKLDAYTKIINKRKDLLKSLKDEQDYKDKIRDLDKTMEATQNELLAISLDNSEEAKAKRLQLEADLAKEKDDIAKTERDRQYDLEQEALDKELAAFKNMIDKQIAAINKYLKDTVQMMIDAMKRLAEATGTKPPSTSTTVPSVPESPPPSGGCCFLAGTKILISDKIDKPIEKIQIGDNVIGIVDGVNTSVKVTGFICKRREGYYSLLFGDGTILNLTNDHPLFTHLGWKSIEPEVSKLSYNKLDIVGRLMIGDDVKNIHGEFIPIVNMRYWVGSVNTFTLVVSGEHQFYAEKMLTHNMCQQMSVGGVVRGGVQGQDSVPVMLTPGEVVLSKAMLNSLQVSSMGGLPSLKNNYMNFGMKIDTLMSINVAGNFDKSTIPDIQKIADKVMGTLNKAMLNRGYLRSINQFSQ